MRERATLTTRLALTTLLIAVVASGCVTKTVKRVNMTAAEHAELEIPEDQLLNVNIAIFATGVGDPVEALEEGIFPEVRDAESRLVPVKLRDTLQNTGHWGAVRVVPREIAWSDLLVTGTILHSDGETLEVSVRAVDASGREWLRRSYEEEAAQLSYTESETSDLDPFQDIYNRIANDLLTVRKERAAEELQEIRRLTFLRFAADLAPDAFGSYLERRGESYRVQGLPAQGDPNVERVTRIRDRDFALIDALDQHYGVFASRIAPPYEEWRAASYGEVANLKQLQGEALTNVLLGAAGVAGGIAGLIVGDGGATAAASGLGIVGGVSLLKSGFDKYAESKIHVEALQELGQSLEGDLKPRVVELEGQTITLSGSAEVQYDEWRRLLREIYESETGFPVGAEAPPVL